MKKLTFIFVGLFISLLSTPIFAQPEDPGGDPETPLPINDYLWVLIAIGLVYVFLRLRTITMQSNIES